MAAARIKVNAPRLWYGDCSQERYSVMDRSRLGWLAGEEQMKLSSPETFTFRSWLRHRGCLRSLPTCPFHHRSIRCVYCSIMPTYITCLPEVCAIDEDTNTIYATCDSSPTKCCWLFCGGSLMIRRSMFTAPVVFVSSTSCHCSQTGLSVVLWVCGEPLRPDRNFYRLHWKSAITGLWIHWILSPGIHFFKCFSSVKYWRFYFIHLECWFHKYSGGVV